MRFAEPWFLVFAALSPFFAVLWLLFRRRARCSMERLAAPSLRARLMPPSSGLDFLQGIFMALALALAGMAAARPQWGLQKGGMVMSRNVVIALDVSRSMLADDVQPSRLEQAKADIADLIGGLDGDNVALVAFRGNAKLLCPLTIDYGFLRTASEGATVHSAGPGPTSIGAALVQSLDALDPALDAHSAIIVLSDGGNLDGSEDAAISKCISRGIPVFTVGYGSVAGALIPDGRGGHVRDHGTNVVSRLEEAALRNIASRTKARYVAIGTAGTASTSLGDIYKEYLEKIAAAEHLAEDSDRMVERFGWFLIPAIVFALAVAALSRGRFSGATRRAVAAIAIAMITAFSSYVQAEGRALNDREKYNSALDCWVSGDSAGALDVLEGLRSSKRFSAKAAALEGLICYSNAVDKASAPEDALAEYLKATSAFQSALRENPDDADMKGNFAIASRDIPALRDELRIKEAKERAKNSPDPAAELARRLGETREIVAKARKLSSVSPQEAVDAADELAERCGHLADDWIPFKEVVATAVTNREQAAELVRIADEARAAALDSAEKIADLNTSQAYSGLMQNEGALYGLWKMSGPPPPQLLDADMFCQSNVVARMEDLNGRSWTVEALDMTGRFRNAFPEWAQRKAEELAAQSTNEPPFSAEDRAEIMRLADETFDLQSSLTNNVDSVSRTDVARHAMENLEKIKKLMPPEKNNNGGNDNKENNQKDDKNNQENKNSKDEQNSQGKDNPQQQPPKNPDDSKKDGKDNDKQQEKSEGASGEKEKDENKKDKTPQDVKDMLRRAIEREREHNDRKNKNPVRFEIERDW